MLPVLLGLQRMIGCGRSDTGSWLFWLQKHAADNCGETQFFATTEKKIKDRRCMGEIKASLGPPKQV